MFVPDTLVPSPLGTAGGVMMGPAMSRARPVAVVVGSAIAGVGDEQRQLLDPRDVEVDALSDACRAHNPAVENCYAIGEHLEIDRRGVDFCVIDADIGKKRGVGAIQVVDDLEARSRRGPWHTERR